MKKIILTVLLITVILPLAQAEKAVKAGNFMLSGDLSGSAYFSNLNVYDSTWIKSALSEENRLALVLAADGGIFLTDGFELGMTAGFGFTWAERPGLPSTNTFTEISFNLGPQLGFYFDLDRSLALFVKGKTAFQFSTRAYLSGTQSFSFAFFANLRSGLAFFINDVTALELGAFGQYQLTRDLPAYTYTGRLIIGLSAGAALFL